MCTKSVKKFLGINTGPTKEEKAAAAQQAAQQAAFQQQLIASINTTPMPSAPEATPAPVMAEAAPQMATVEETSEEEKKKKLARAMLRGRSALRIDRLGSGGGSTSGLQMPA